MKRRLISIFALVLVVAMVASFAVGCNFFRENDYRVANETYVTVKHDNGVTLTVSYNEILDYCNSSSRLYSYVNYYGLSVGEALDLCIQGKIQATYLLAEAMGYLTDASKTSQERVSALYGGGAKGKAEDVLTFAERYLAIYSVNKSIDESLEANAKTAKEEDWSRAYRAIEDENVKEVVLTEDTLAYLAKFFDGENGKCVIGAELDNSKIKAQVVYDDDTKSAEFIVPSEGYSVAFSSAKTDNYAEREEAKNFTVLFKETKLNDKGEEETEEHTYVYDYTLVYPRDVKAEAEEEVDYSVVTIDEVDVPRYAKDADIAPAVKKVANIRDVDKEYADLIANGGDKYMIDAYRQLLENMKANNRDMSYFYKAQFDAQANTSFSEEVYIKAEKAFDASTDLDARIVKEYKYLAENQKNTYNGQDEEEVRKAFVSKISSTGTGMDTLYYIPEVVDLNEYFFVKQVLFKFSSEVLAFLETVRHDEDALKEACEYFEKTEKVVASNPNYDVDYDCPKHELKEDGATCKFASEAEGNLEANCPSKAFLEVDKTIKEVIGDMQTELQAIYSNTELTAEEKEEKAIAYFEEMLYTYCDDQGSFNADWGYLIAKEEDDNGWVKDFTNLAKDIYAYGQNAGNAFTADGTIGTCYTTNLTGSTSSDYAGVTAMMIVKTPFANATATDLANMNDADVITFLKSNFNGKGVSLYDAMKKSLKEEDKNLAYNEYIKIVPQDIYERDEDNNKITVDKKYKGKIEINTNKLKKNIYDEYTGK